MIQQKYNKPFVQQAVMMYIAEKKFRRALLTSYFKF